jgi:hypothetical protein
LVARIAQGDQHLRRRRVTRIHPLLSITTDTAADDKSLSADCTAILTVVNSRNGGRLIVMAIVVAAA